MTIALLEVRLDAQRDALEQKGTFTTVLVAGQNWGTRRPTLLVEEGWVVELGHIAVEKQRVATGQRRLRFTRFLKLEAQVKLDQIAENLEEPFGRHFEQRRRTDLVLPAGTGKAVSAALFELSAEVAEVGDDFLRPRRPRRRRLQGVALQAVAQEADAVRLAIDIAGLPRHALRGLHPDGERPFLVALAEVRVYEDQAIDYDAGRFLDFDRLEQPNGVVHFARGNDRLTVLNVNRRPLERTTGADLIYYNETQDSYVLVQYKTMRREIGEDGTQLVFRPDADARLQDELERMRAFAEVPGDGSAEQWRLHPGCCYIKLCRPVLDIDYPPRELVGGMYLPLDYWDLLAASAQTLGPRDGRIFTFQNVPRRIDNSLFVNLVHGGWIGSRAETTESITELVLNGLDANRSVTVAAAWRDERDYRVTDR